MQVSDLFKYDALAKVGYTYVSDPDDQDIWRSHAHEVSQGLAWEDDCDGLASTTLELLCAVWDQSLLWRAMVRAEGSPPNIFVDHMIGLAKTPGGLLYIVGDTFGDPCLLTQRGHKVQMVSRIIDGVGWVQGVPA